MVEIFSSFIIIAQLNYINYSLDLIDPYPDYFLIVITRVTPNIIIIQKIFNVEIDRTLSLQLSKVRPKEKLLQNPFIE